MKKNIILIISCITIQIQSTYSAENSISKIPSLKQMAKDVIDTTEFINEFKKRAQREEQIRKANLLKLEFIDAQLTELFINEYKKRPQGKEQTGKANLLKLKSIDSPERLSERQPDLALLKSCNNDYEGAALRAKYQRNVDADAFIKSNESQQRVEKMALLIDVIQQKQEEKSFELALQEAMKTMIQKGDVAFKKAFAKNGNFQGWNSQIQENNKNIKMLTHASSDPKEFIHSNYLDFSFHLIRFGDLELIKFYHNRFPNYFKQKISLKKTQPSNSNSQPNKAKSKKISPYAFALRLAQEEIKRTSITPETSFKTLKDRIAITDLLNPHKCSDLEDLVFDSYTDRSALKNFAFERMKFNKKLSDENKKPL